MSGRLIDPNLWLEKKVKPKGTSQMQWLCPYNIPYLNVKQDFGDDVEVHEYPNLRIPKIHLEIYTG